MAHCNISLIEDLSAVRYTSQRYTSQISGFCLGSYLELPTQPSEINENSMELACGRIFKPQVSQTACSRPNTTAPIFLPFRDCASLNEWSRGVFPTL